MSKIFDELFDWSHLTEIPTSALYQKYLLFPTGLMVVIPILLLIFLRIKKRSRAYKKFDNMWLWGYIAFGLSGLFVIFSVNQSLPMFGTRLAVFIWLGLAIIYAIYLTIYFRKVTVKEVVSFNEKKRKEKYLKR